MQPDTGFEKYWSWSKLAGLLVFTGLALYSVWTGRWTEFLICLPFAIGFTPTYRKQLRWAFGRKYRVLTAALISALMPAAGGLIAVLLHVKLNVSPWTFGLIGWVLLLALYTDIRIQHLKDPFKSMLIMTMLAFGPVVAYVAITNRWDLLLLTSPTLAIVAFGLWRVKSLSGQIAE